MSSAGIDRALLVSGAGAWLLDLGTGDRTPVGDLGGTHDVDLAARSFVVSVPRDALPVAGTWTLRVGAGLADEDGDEFLQLTPEHGALPGGASLYNVGYRGYDDEPAEHNFWFDRSQAEALSARNVSPFALELDWGVLADGRTDPEPAPTGWSNRWYVSSVELGQGRVQGEGSTSDGAPNYLGRVQPYGVWIPSDRDPAQPASLTWLLHSFTINHNQYAATAPDTLRALCEGRRSVCVTTLGRGPDGQYRDVAELDLWEVWHDVASHVALDPDRTVIGGYSMGGFGAWRIAAMHPDLFAGMFLLSSAARDDLPLATNLRSIPYYHDHGALDQLVPITQARETIARLDELGHRYVFDVHPTEDRVAYSLKDGWRQLVTWAGEEDRTAPRRPARIDYTWFPADVDDELGIGPDGAWWLSDLRARDDAAGPPEVRARSSAIAEPEHELVRTRSVLTDAAPSPAVRERLDWTVGEPGPTTPSISLELAGVASLQVDVDDAALDTAASGAEVAVATDGPTRLALTGVPDGTVVLLDGRRVGTAPAAATLDVPEGDHTVTFSAPGSADRSRADAPGLPATGGGVGTALVLIGVGALLRGSLARHGSREWV
ncbi:MAG: peptidase [Actinobacteria bacterium]|nr:peptidase [Actinomycetota bacterium]